MRPITIIGMSIAAALAASACDSESEGDQGTSASTTSAKASSTTGTGGTSTSTTGSGGSDGGAGGAGGAACKSCAEMVTTADGDPSHVCAGNSAMLLGEVLMCTCAPDVCGGPGDGCEEVCAAGMGEITQACIECDQEAAAGVCMAQFDACFADQ